MKEQDHKQEGAFAIIVALIVLFSAMWNPLVSVIISIVALISFALWKLLK